ncbi:MAG TPA: 50S ribosomal protein L5 [Candidatus Eremiobacteraceae bacterium]|nr:50S ribosomal protein L5 [Candidatus Eremiobacteraceae bacterium]
MNRLRERYEKQVVPALRKRFGFANPMQVPRLTKIVINMGVGEAVAEPKTIDGAVADLTAISGQKPVITRAKKSIATYKLREGMQIGAKVTLRGDRMYAFFDKLVNIVLPRIRDFRGMSRTSLDGRGNYALGLKEQIVFPEINYDKVDRVRGMDIVIVTTAHSDEHAVAFMEEMGMPLRREGAAA